MAICILVYKQLIFVYVCEKEEKGNALFNDTHHIIFTVIWLYGTGHIVMDQSVGEETCCHNVLGYSF